MYIYTYLLLRVESPRKGFSSSGSLRLRSPRASKTPCFRAWQPPGPQNTVPASKTPCFRAWQPLGLKQTVLSCVAATGPQKHRAFVRGSHFQRNHSRKTSLLLCTLCCYTLFTSSVHGYAQVHTSIYTYIYTYMSSRMEK